MLGLERSSDQIHFRGGYDAGTPGFKRALISSQVAVRRRPSRGDGPGHAHQYLHTPPRRHRFLQQFADDARVGGRPVPPGSPDPPRCRQADARVVGARMARRAAAIEFLGRRRPTPPEPTYEPVDTAPVLDAVTARTGPAALRATWSTTGSAAADAIEHTVRMLTSRETPAFFEHSRALYGVPDQPLRYDPATPLELARRVHDALVELHEVDLVPPVDSHAHR